MTAPTAFSPEQILSAVLTLAKRQLGHQRFAFRGHDYNLQSVIRDLSQRPEYPLLRTFVFSDIGPEPYSPGLSDSVSKLQLAGLLGRENPDYEVIFLNPAAESYFDRVLSQRLGPNERHQLESIAKDFVAAVKVP